MVAILDSDRLLADRLQYTETYFPSSFLRHPRWRGLIEGCNSLSDTMICVLYILYIFSKIRFTERIRGVSERCGGVWWDGGLRGDDASRGVLYSLQGLFVQRHRARLAHRVGRGWPRAALRGRRRHHVAARVLRALRQAQTPATYPLQLSCMRR